MCPEPFSFQVFQDIFREGRDSEIAPTEDRPEHQVRITGQLNGSEMCQIFCILYNLVL